MNKSSLIAASVAAVIVVGYLAATHHFEAKAEEELNNIFAEASHLVDITYEDVDLSLIGGELSISDIQIVTKDQKQTKTIIDQVVIYNGDQNEDHFIPFYLDVEIKGLKISVDEQQAQDLKELGYDKDFVINARLAYDYDEKAKFLKLERVNLGVADMGVYNAAVALGNIDLTSEDPMLSLLLTYHTITLHSGELSYEDDSLIDRIFTLEAEKKGKSVAELKGQFQTSIEKKIKKLKDDQSAVNTMQALSRFIQNTDKISISFKPEKPLALGSIAGENNKDRIISLLNIKIK